MIVFDIMQMNYSYTTKGLKETFPIGPVMLAVQYLSPENHKRKWINVIPGNNVGDDNVTVESHPHVLLTSASQCPPRDIFQILLLKEYLLCYMFTENVQVH